MVLLHHVLKDKFNKPTIIISLKDKLEKHQQDQVVGFDIGSVIISAITKKIIIKGGGHKMAGGFSILENKIEKFKKFIFKKFKKKIDNNSKK